MTKDPATCASGGCSLMARQAVLDALAAHGRDWLGHTVALFACQEQGLFEELAQRTLDDHGQVTVVRDAPFSVAAKLRFPVTAEQEGSR
jgi:hypothetical protein